MYKKSLFHEIFSIRVSAIIVFGVIALYYYGQSAEQYYAQVSDLPTMTTNGFTVFQSAVFMQNLYFIFFFIKISFIYPARYLREKNNGVGIFLVNRLGYKKYFYNHVLKTVILSAYVEISTLLLYLIYCLTKYGYITPDYAITGERQTFYIEPIFWTLVVLMTFALFAVILSLISLGCSYFIKKYYLIYTSSTIFNFSIIIILNLINSFTYNNAIIYYIVSTLFPANVVGVFMYNISLETTFMFTLSILFYLGIALYLLNCLYEKDSTHYL